MHAKYESSFMKFIHELYYMDVVEVWTPLWEGWFLGPCIFYFLFLNFFGGGLTDPILLNKIDRNSSHSIGNGGRGVNNNN
jgi:hypothetical protein